MFILHPVANKFEMTSEKEKALEERKNVSNEDIMEKIVIGLAATFSKTRCADCGDILVVDDNEFNRFLLIQLLEKYGFKCGSVLQPINK